jgi:hypothetical protein
MKRKSLPPNFNKWAEFFAQWGIDYSFLANDPWLGAHAFTLPSQQLLIAIRPAGYLLTRPEQEALSNQAWVTLVASNPEHRGTLFCQTLKESSGGWDELDTVGWGFDRIGQFGIVCDVRSANHSIVDWHWASVPSAFCIDQVHRWALRTRPFTNRSK